MESKELTEKIYESLNEVIDPELGIGIVDLGLIYEVKAATDQKEIEVTMTLTTPSCPMSEILSNLAKDTLKSQYTEHSVQINVVWEPAWSPEKISPNGKRDLGME
jgi:metal-sulfur cluster biosynthetic enzyme